MPQKEKKQQKATYEYCTTAQQIHWKRLPQNDKFQTQLYNDFTQDDAKAHKTMLPCA